MSQLTSSVPEIPANQSREILQVWSLNQTSDQSSRARNNSYKSQTIALRDVKFEVGASVERQDSVEKQVNEG